MRGSLSTTLLKRSLGVLIAFLLTVSSGGCGGGAGGDSSENPITILYCVIFPWSCPLLQSSNSNTDNVSASSGQSSYTVGGRVSGLSSSGLVLQKNGYDDLTISENDMFTFATPINDGESYTVSVKIQPSESQTCRVYNGTGIIAGANVTNVSVICSTWPKQMGVAGATTWATGVAGDSGNNMYVTGWTNGGLDGNALTGMKDFFLVKYDSEGGKIFTKQMGVAGADTMTNGIAVDSSGNVFMTGYTSGGLDGNALTGTKDFFLVKYDSAGDKIFTKQMGVAGADTIATGIAVDSSGNVYMTGYTSGGLDGNALTGTKDFFLVKYDSEGNRVYTKQMGAGLETKATSVSVDSNNIVYVTGFTSGGLDGNTLTGSYDFFLTKYDSLGNRIQTTQMGVVGKETRATGVAVDSSGNVYVTGYTEGGLDGNIRTGFFDSFLVKYDSGGNKIYTTQMGVTELRTEATDVAVDSNGNVYVTGNMSYLEHAFFLVMYDSTGNKVYSTQMNIEWGWTSTTSVGVAVDSSGNVYVTGTICGGLAGTLSGLSDFFLVKDDSSGNIQ